MLIRRESPLDHQAVRAVHDAAFATGGGSPADESTLVDQLRADGDALAALTLVAEVDGDVVGHVMCSRADLAGRASVGLAPVGVLPQHQARGVGSALLHAVLGAADALEVSEVVLLGDPGYYRRFGFEPAQPLGILAPDPQWAEHFLVRTLTSWTGAVRGPFRYAPAFGLG